MKFYNRTEEIKKLTSISALADEKAQFTVMTGRRRIGKTQLLLKAFEDQKFLYFFVAKKPEALLCKDFLNEVSSKLGVPILGEATSFVIILEYLFHLSQNEKITLVIDEFQDFQIVNPSIYSEMQRVWDLNKMSSRLNLIVSGSVISLMHKIFENYNEPLFGRAQHFIRLQPFDTATIKEILNDYNPKFDNEDLLALYSFTGGVAKYVEIFIDHKALTKEAMIAIITSRDSLFLYEGKNMLIEEFGKDYLTYFSILSLIAEGKHTRSQLEEQLKKEVGGYLTKLEQDFRLIKKAIPIFGKGTKNMKYFLEDNFLIFWFRFIYKYNYMVETGSYELLKQLILRDYTVFSGIMLERYFRLQAAESGNYTRVGNYWDRKGEIEIDMIAANEIDKEMKFIEVKRNKDKISIELLKRKTMEFEKLHPNLVEYKKDFFGLSLENM